MCGASSAGCLPAAACWHRMCQLRAGKIWICLLPGSAPLHERFFQLSAWNAEPELPQGGQNLGKGLRQILQLRTRTAVTAPGVLCAHSWQGLQTVFLSFYSFSKQTHLISSCLFLSPARKKKEGNKKKWKGAKPSIWWNKVGNWEQRYLAVPRGASVFSEHLMSQTTC